ncbi:site-specific integrase [Heliobacterium chlorum]|uniref:Site-specific integrase n=1 Tax=Heliobacterium chlorum TaxID=2698 RepID=A0ABR7T8U6_HELCL|nr:site-specific integrase [Heliobacterium chlorum]MBC9786369.1 site-specific integrase [Heliobacterium chlorum]
MVDQGQLKQNPLEGIKKKRQTNRIVHIDDEVLSQLLELPDKSTFSGLRDYALLMTSIDTGARPGELLAVLPNHFNPVSRELIITNDIAKTGVQRTLPLSPIVVDAIRQLQRYREDDWKNHIPIFCTWSGEPYKVSAWTHRVESYAKKLEVHITPYMLRHNFALKSLRNKADVFSIQRIMGHSDLAMTKRYVSLSQEDIRNTHASTSPLNTLVKTPQKRKKKLT